MQKEHNYKAFISYRHNSFDKKVAERLQRMLESYKVPKGMSKKEKWRIFRDETELPSSTNLSDDIKTALKNSEFLIVICSRTTAQSRWCLEEIKYFKSLHNQTNDNIITLLIDGEPDEVFPAELQTTTVDDVDDLGYVKRKEIIVEPLAANITSSSKAKSLKKLKTEFLRIAAPLIGCGYDDLYNRERRKKVKALATGIAAVFIGITAFGIYNSVMLMKLNSINTELAAKNTELELKTHELDTSNTELTQTNTELDKANNSLDKTIAELDESNSRLEAKNTELDTVNSRLSITNRNLDKANESLKESNSELDKSNANLQKSNDSLEKKTKEAENNLEEANKQRDIAEKNLSYAEEQRTAAENNLAYAQEQQQIAEHNLTLLQEKNRELLISGANMAAKTAEVELDNNNREGAIRTILDNRPYEDDASGLLPSGMNILSKAMYLYQSTSAPQIDRYLETVGNIEYCEYNLDKTKLLAYDDESYLYIWDAENGQTLYNENISEDINQITFYSNENVIVSTAKKTYLVNCLSGDIQWSKNSNEIFEQEYITASSVHFSSDKSRGVLVSASDYISCIDIMTGDILYTIKPEISNGYYYKTGCFYSNNKFILSYYSSDYSSGDVKYNTQFWLLDIDNKTCEQIQYETDLQVFGTLFCAADRFAIEGCRYGESDEYYVCVVSIGGKEMFSTCLTDYSQWFEDIIFCTYRSENFQMLVLASDLDLIFIDMNTGDIFYRTRFDAGIKNIYAIDKDGIFRVLCKDGVYGLDLNSLTEDKYLKLNYENSKAVSFFLWGNQDKYAVAGQDKHSIVLYRNQNDDHYTQISTAEYLWGERIDSNGKYLAGIASNAIFVYDVQGKELLSQIPYSYEYYFCGDSILTRDGKELTWYDIETGDVKNTHTMEEYPTLYQTSDMNAVIACVDSKIYKITDTIVEVFVPDEGYIAYKGLYIDKSGEKAVAEICSIDGLADVYKFCAINLDNGEYTVLNEGKTELFEYNTYNAEYSDDVFILNKDGKLMIFDTNKNMLLNEIPFDKIAVKDMVYSENDRSVIVYSGNNIAYKYNVDSGELIKQLVLETDQSGASSTEIEMDVIKEQNLLIIKRYSKAWFIDLSSMEIIYEIPTDFICFMPSTQEIVLSISDSIRFYPYYTSAQLIDMAEDVIKGKER